MVAYLKTHSAVRLLLVEKTDRLYRNIKDWVTIDELEVEIHFPKEGVVLSRDSRREVHARELWPKLGDGFVRKAAYRGGWKPA
jgi:hypothetical protein